MKLSSFAARERKLSSFHSGRHDEQHGSANDEDETEDDETDAVDDCSGNHPFVHHLLMLVLLTTPLTVTAQSRLQQVVDVVQHVG